MRTEILTLEGGSSTLDVCKHIALTMEVFSGRCYIYQVNKKSSILYCALFTDEKISQKDAEVVYKALELTRLYEREREYLEENIASKLDTIYEELKELIERKVIHKVPKTTKLMDELINTYIK